MMTFFHFIVAPSETSSTSMTTRSRTYSTRTSGSKEAAAKTVEKYFFLLIYVT